MLKKALKMALIGAAIALSSVSAYANDATYTQNYTYSQSGPDYTFNGSVTIWGPNGSGTITIGPQYPRYYPRPPVYYPPPVIYYPPPQYIPYQVPPRIIWSPPMPGVPYYPYYPR